MPQIKKSFKRKQYVMGFRPRSLPDFNGNEMVSYKGYK
jgi:hypothetical protein